MMRLLVLNYEYPPLGGGAGNATRYILGELDGRPDLQIDLITSSVGDFRVEQLGESVTGHFLDIGKRGNLHYQTQRELLVYAWKSFHYVRRLARSRKPDIVHAFFGIPSGYIAMQLGLPYIVSLRGSDVPFYNERFEALDRLLFQRLSRTIWQNAAAVVANSTGLRDLALKTSKARTIDVIFNGVDTKKFVAAKIKPRGEKIRLVSTGRLIGRKGYEYLIEALRGREEFELRLIGDGPLAKDLADLSARLKVHVKLLGRLEPAAVIPELQRSDIFVLPSLNEGMSNSLLEALSCGLPAVATNVGGSDELVDDGVNGFIVEKANSAALAEALDKYAADRSLIDRHGKASRVVAEKMSWGAVAAQYLDLYRQIIS